MSETQNRACILSEIRASFSLFSWSLAALVKPVAERVIQRAVHYPAITPNRVTAVCLILRLTVALLFLLGTAKALAGGALAYYFVAVLDAVDGPIARLTGKSSEFGRYFDHISDLFGDIVILAALACGQSMFDTPLVPAMIFMHMAESYVSYLTNAVLACPGQNRVSTLMVRLLRPYLDYRNACFSRNLKTFFSFPDYALLTFVVFPLAGMPQAGIVYGFYFLLLIVLYTFFSTFVAVHCDSRKFP